ncbi:unnamed protein product [Rhodiola kirilowii]
MRVIVPLQGVVQGRGGLILGSILPCTLFFLLQLYLKRNRRPPSDPTPPSPDSHFNQSTSALGPVQVSLRAESIANPTPSAYYLGWSKYLEDPYHKLTNPSGIIQLGLAENRLSFVLIEKWMNDNLEGVMLNGDSKIDDMFLYQPSDGMLAMKKAMANFMSRVMRTTTPFIPSHLVLTSGATAAIEIISFCLADQGNGLLVPTPYYPGFDRDVIWRIGVKLIPVHCRSCDNFSPSIDSLEQAFKKAMRHGIKVRGVLISNPSNPIGNILSRDFLNSLLGFAKEKNIHIISDEIYAGSVYGDDEFVSMAEIAGSNHTDKQRIHIIYGVSKDLSLPGFRIGVVHSFNETVLTTAKRLARFTTVSSPTQRIMLAMLSDSSFIKEYMKTNNERLKKMHHLVVSGLTELGIECAKSVAGFYCWVNMRQLMGSYNENGELALWDKLLNVAKINITPGSSCHCIEPGWFRLCFANMDEDDIPVIMDRIKNVVNMSCND